MFSCCFSTRKGQNCIDPVCIERHAIGFQSGDMIPHICRFVFNVFMSLFSTVVVHTEINVKRQKL